MGLSHRCRVGNYKSWKFEGKLRVGDFLPRAGKEMSLRIECLGILWAGRCEAYSYIERIDLFIRGNTIWLSSFLSWLGLIGKAQVNVTLSDLMDKA